MNHFHEYIKQQRKSFGLSVTSMFPFEKVDTGKHTEPTSFSAGISITSPCGTKKYEAQAQMCACPTLQTYLITELGLKLGFLTPKSAFPI